MGEGTNRVDEPTADELAARVERSRDRLDTLVSALDQRRHLFVRFKETLVRHKVWAAAVGLVVLGALGTAAQLSRRHHQKQRTLRARMFRLTEALGRMLDKPERVARTSPDVGSKMLSTAASTLTGMLIKRAGASLSDGDARRKR
jgi:hypothetical protein